MLVSIQELVDAISLLPYKFLKKNLNYVGVSIIPQLIFVYFKTYIQNFLGLQNSKALFGLMIAAFMLLWPLIYVGRLTQYHALLKKQFLNMIAPN
jgi:hypothetical protein